MSVAAVAVMFLASTTALGVETVRAISNLCSIVFREKLAVFAEAVFDDLVFREKAAVFKVAAIDVLRASNTVVAAVKFHSTCAVCAQSFVCSAVDIVVVTV